MDDGTFKVAAGPSDLFSAFYEPLQLAAQSKRHGEAEAEGLDYLDPETGLAVQWILALQNRWIELEIRTLMIEDMLKMDWMVLSDSIMA